MIVSKRSFLKRNFTADLAVFFLIILLPVSVHGSTGELGSAEYGLVIDSGTEFFPISEISNSGFLLAQNDQYGQYQRRYPGDPGINTDCESDEEGECIEPDYPANQPEPSGSQRGSGRPNDGVTTDSSQLSRRAWERGEQQEQNERAGQDSQPPEEGIPPDFSNDMYRVDIIRQQGGAGNVYQQEGGGTRTRGGGGLERGGVNRGSGSGGESPTGACPLKTQTYPKGDNTKDRSGRDRPLTKCVSDPNECRSDRMNRGLHDEIFKKFCSLKHGSKCQNKTCDVKTKKCVPVPDKSVAILPNQVDPNKDPNGSLAVGYWEFQVRKASYDSSAEVRSTVNRFRNEFNRNKQGQTVKSTKSCGPQKPYQCVWHDVSVVQDVRCKCVCQ